MKKTLAFVQIVNGLMVFLGVYRLFTTNETLYYTALTGLNAYLFISGYDNIKEQFFTKELK